MFQDIVNFTSSFKHIAITKSGGGHNFSMKNVNTENGSAEIAIEEIKLLKKFLQNKKATIREQLQEIRQNRRTDVANQMVMPRGGGKLGMFVRWGIALSRASDRSNHDDNIQPYEELIQAIDQFIIACDQCSTNIKKALLAEA